MRMTPDIASLKGKKEFRNLPFVGFTYTADKDSVNTNANTDKEHNLPYPFRVSRYKYVAVFYHDQGQVTTPMFENTSRVDLDNPAFEEEELVSSVNYYISLFVLYCFYFRSIKEEDKLKKWKSLLRTSF